MSITKQSSSNSLGNDEVYKPDLLEDKPEDNKSLYRFVLLFTLFLSFTSNIISRYLIVFLYSAPVDDIEPEKRYYYSMKEELGLNSTQYGYLTGPCFMAVFALVGFFAGWACDNLNRKYTMVVGLVLTAGSILGMGFVNEFWHLLLLRGLLAAGQAFFPPLGYAIISEYFSASSRVTVNGVLSSGVYAGYGLATLSLILIDKVGWRNCSKYVGYMSSAIIVLFVASVFEAKKAPAPSPTVNGTVNASPAANSDVEDGLNSSNSNSGEIEKPKRSALADWFQSFVTTLRSPHLQVLILAATFRLGAGAILGGYLPVLMKERFPKQRDTFAILNTVIVPVAGVLSSYVGGRIADRWYRIKVAKAQLQLESPEQPSDIPRNDDTDMTSPLLPGDTTPPAEPPTILSPYLYIASFSCILSLPLFTVVFLAQNLYLAMGALFVAYLFSECYFSPLLATIQGTPTIAKGSKGMGISLLLGFSQCFGSIFTVAVGYIDDRVNSTQWELIAGVVGCNAIAGIILFIGAWTIR